MLRFWRSIAAAVFLLAACGKQEAVSAAKPEAAEARASAQLALPPSARAFLVDRGVAAEPSGDAAQLFRAHRVPSQGPVRASRRPFAGRVATVAVEPGKRVAAGDTLFTIESADVLGLRASLEQARIRCALPTRRSRGRVRWSKRGVGLEAERFEAEMKAREARAELERASATRRSRKRAGHAHHRGCTGRRRGGVGQGGRRRHGAAWRRSSGRSRQSARTVGHRRCAGRRGR